VRVKSRSKAIVEAVSHDEAHLIFTALGMLASTIYTLDGRHPSPEARADAEMANRLAEEFSRANAARQFIEEGS